MNKQLWAGLVASMLAGLAQAEPIVKTNVQVSQLSYSVAALEGFEAEVAPTVSFTPFGSEAQGIDFFEDGETPSAVVPLAGAPWPTTTGNFSSPNGATTVATGPDGFSVSTSLASTDLAGNFQRLEASQPQMVGANIGFMYQYEDGYKVTLSPHSQVTISGILDYTAEWDRSALIALGQASRPDLAGGFYTLTLGLGAEWDDVIPLFPSASLYEATTLVAEASALDNSLETLSSGPLAFSITIRNDLDVSGSGQWSWGAASVLSLSMDPLVTEAPSGVIPEPGTWALMGLGLIALFGLRQRR